MAGYLPGRPRAAADDALRHPKIPIGLGAALISREEQTLFPGQQLETKLPLSPDTVFIGVFAAFRDFQSTRWRAITRAPEKSKIKVLKKLRLQVQVDKGAISVSTP